MSTHTIRVATADDLPTVGLLWRRLCEVHRQNELMHAIGEHEVAQWIESFERHLGRFAFMWVSEQGRVVDGFMLARLKVQPQWLGGLLVGDMSAMYLEESARGAAAGHIARQMVDAAIASLAAAGASAIEANIYESNAHSMAFFAKAGFEPTSRTLTKPVHGALNADTKKRISE